MPLSQIVRKTCESCGKIAVEKSRVRFGQSTMITLECGHVMTDTAIAANQLETVVSKDGKTLMPYQIETVRQVEEANGRALIAHEQGLGKTVIVNAIFKLHQQELLPAVIVMPTTVKAQWYHELVRWVGGPFDKSNPIFIQILGGVKDVPFPKANVYIISYDVLKKISFEHIPIKTVVLDECQRIKNHLSERAKAVQNLVKETKAEHILGLSGTPIKNNAGEYFTILNLLQPRRFPTYQGYIDNYCDAYWNGYGNKVGGLKDVEKFRATTSDFIFRKTKAEVLPDLPPLSRKFYHVELDKRLNKAYSSALKELDDIFYDDETDEMERASNILAIMTKMRKITGISKTLECADFVVEHLESTDRKIVIFLHHKDAQTLLENKLNEYIDSEDNVTKASKPLNLVSDLNAYERAAIVDKFREDPNCRILIASTLAAGEGLNLQFCSDAVMLERQWNPANEEQAEARFHRFGQINPVSIAYMLASETIDEYFTDLVEQKRAIVASTLDGKEVAWDQSSLINELAAILTTKGKDRWRL